MASELHCFGDIRMSLLTDGIFEELKKCKMAISKYKLQSRQVFDIQKSRACLHIMSLLCDSNLIS